MSKQMENIPYLLSFLCILVYRNGGKLEVNNLSEFANKSISLKMDLDKENDKVLLYTEEPTRQ